MRTISALPMAMVLAFPVGAAAQTGLLDDPALWKSEGAMGEIVRDGGEPVVRLNGQFSLEDLTFTDGTIEFEIRLTGLASFAGFFTRIDAAGANGEHIYVRPHKSTEWDAIQYQPIQNGSSTWQVYVGPGYTAPAVLPAGEWLPIRVRIAGSLAEVFVGAGSTEPTMRLTLQSSSGSGSFALYAGFRGNLGGGRPAAEFRRLRIDPTRPQVAAAPAPPPLGDDIVPAWRVGTPVAVEPGPIRYIPASAPAGLLRPDARGLVNLTQRFTKVADAARSAVSAEAVLTADRAVTVPMLFDYSDDASIFLNGELIYSGENGWSSKYEYYMGLVRPEALKNTAWLHLRPGKNTLTFVVAEQYFGWGFAARITRPAGVQVGVE